MGCTSSYLAFSWSIFLGRPSTCVIICSHQNRHTSSSIKHIEDDRSNPITRCNVTLKRCLFIYLFGPHKYLISHTHAPHVFNQPNKQTGSDICFITEHETTKQRVKMWLLRTFYPIRGSRVTIPLLSTQTQTRSHRKSRVTAVPSRTTWAWTRGFSLSIVVAAICPFTPKKLSPWPFTCL